MEEQVNHPSHYVKGIEPIEVIESWDLNFSLGNAIKYILRSPYKGKQIEDLEKARWYIDREINRLKGDEYMLMLVFRVYAATVAVALLSQMLTTARAQINGISLSDDELLHTIILAALPLLNLVIAFDNLIMLFRSKPQFILRYMFVRDRLDEIKILEDKEDDKEC